MKTPPLLLLAALIFWGWESGFLLAGALMGAVLESARIIQARWELTPQDFRRIWQFCTLLVLAVVVYAFAENDEDGGLTGAMHSGLAATRHLSVSATAFLRWLPMSLFLLILAQTFSERESVPLASISVFMRNRQSATRENDVNISYPYFMICIFSAGIHYNTGEHSYFWGQAILLIWALWPSRSRRFGFRTWLGMLVVVAALGFFGQRALADLQRIINGYNARWMAAFMSLRTDASKSVTAIGQVGRLELSPAIVIRLQTEPGAAPPQYLREASYREYHTQNQGWYTDAQRNDFETIANDAGNESSWTLVPGKTNLSRVNIAAYLEGRSPETDYPEGLLPLPDGAGHLDKLSAFFLKKNKLGAVLATGPGLVIFDAHYGPGASLDAPPDAGTNRVDLKVPPNEAPALEKVVAEMNVAGATEEQKKLAVQRFFSANFRYSVWIGPEKVARTNATALARFLLQSRSGHCEYFATATVLLLRELGIPARYAVGYYVHEPAGHGYVVRGRDAHAWCLAWNGRTKTWENFDTTPGSWVADENNRASAFQWITDFWSWARFQFARLKLLWGETKLRNYILWLLLPVLAYLLYQIVFRRRRKKSVASHNQAADEPDWPGLDSEFYALEKKLAARGVPRQPSELLSDWLARALEDPALAEWREPLAELLRLHYIHRFDPRGLSAPERAALARQAKICLDALVKMPSPATAGHF